METHLLAGEGVIRMAPSRPDIKYPKETLTRGLTPEVSFWAWPQRQKKEPQANKMLTAL